MDCIFCRIVSGELPSYKVFEDESIIAILDISQATKGHTLVISKDHHRNLYDLDENQVSSIFKNVPKLARAIKAAFNPIGMNLLSNMDKPLQSVFHFHLHLIPRYEEDGVNMAFPNQYDKLTKDYFSEIMSRIKDEIKKEKP